MINRRSATLSTRFPRNKEQVGAQEVEIAKILEETEQTRRLSRVWVHFDMDMFYAAVEMRENPSLRDKPMAVGSNSMLSTSNYAARKFGVRSAMPGFIAKKLCPSLIIVPCNFRKYHAASKLFKAVLRRYDADMEGSGLDEAAIDLTDFLKRRKIPLTNEIAI